MSIYILVKWSLFQIKDRGETKNIANKHLFRLTAASCIPLINMSNLITVNRFGKVLIWVWNRCIKKTAIPYEELDFHYPDWAFIITGCIFFGVVVGVTLFYFAFIKQ